MEYIKSFLGKITESLPTSQALAALIFSLLAPLKFALFGIITLTIIDAMCAITLAIKRKENVESKKLRKTIEKLAIYLLAIGGAYLAEVSVSGPETQPGIMVKSLVFLITGAECKSLLETLSSLMASSERLNFWQVLLSNLQGKALQSATDATNDTPTTVSKGVTDAMAQNQPAPDSKTPPPAP